MEVHHLNSFLSQRNSRILILNKEGDWWKGECDGQVGEVFFFSSGGYSWSHNSHLVHLVVPLQPDHVTLV